MKLIADLHVHSRFSRATAKNLDFENLFVSAMQKGINIVATGDFTHPGWMDEIREKLEPAGAGLFRLKPEIAKECKKKVPLSCQNDVRFILETEISNIYKKNGKTRKNHNLIYAPDVETALKINSKLDAIGNLASDGRPILGLDSRKLLEIMLECSDEAFMVPAHIWTPWFSLLGSKSGFDSVKECFEDLSDEIFCVETGLSSDAPMNWRIRELDRRTLISNSDAHSPFNLGRNANLFDIEPSFFDLRDALKSKDRSKCLGTLDMYPQEGKYHMDGHRKCGVCLHPGESIDLSHICPVCQKPLTIGVLSRVEELSDRPEGQNPPNAIPYQYIIPLAEILSEIFKVGPKTKTVNMRYQKALEILGPEMDILLSLPVSQIKKANIPLLDEAIKRMRAGKIHISPGFDGEYGKITLFDADEMERLAGQKALFDIPATKRKKRRAKAKTIKKRKTQKSSEPARKKEIFPENGNDFIKSLNRAQWEAAVYDKGPVIIMAGPGSGKTRTLTARIFYLMEKRKVPPEKILGVTFTKKAARQMNERLLCISGKKKLPLLTTFHSLCHNILKNEGKGPKIIIDEDERLVFIKNAIDMAKNKISGIKISPGKTANLISSAKHNLMGPEDDLTKVAGFEKAHFISVIYEFYQKILNLEKALDYDDLIYNTVKLFEENEKIRQKYENMFEHILIDEYQDLNHAQYLMVKALAPCSKEIFVIGDPDQSIYGFRGSDVRFFTKFTDDYPDAKIIRLEKNYRSAQAILDASWHVIKDHSLAGAQCAIHSGISGIEKLPVMETPTEKAEAVAIGKIIESLVGGTGFHSIDFGNTKETGMETDRAFSDFAILLRNNSQAEVFEQVLGKAGIPFQIVKKSHIFDQKGISEVISILKIISGRAISNDFMKIAHLDYFKTGKFPMKSWLENCRKKGIMPAKAIYETGSLPHFSEKISLLKSSLKELSMENKIKFILDNPGLAPCSKKDNKTVDALEILFKIARENNDPESFTDSLAFYDDPDIYEYDVQKVAIMTIHSAKGLEFPVVFIAGCEDGYLPHKGYKDEKTDIDEERRLFYVAMTRAKELLYFTYAQKRVIYGKKLDRTLSPFVKEIEDHLIKTKKSVKKKKKEVQLSLFN